ncbi:uncharacterized protein LOC132201683 [Neocloeon triangulifer]|uniref:uncharacterized protein LOC132201683 n=1 Tax=Neocloeon triangulifer TaxID=2078957 RepID=UPI00286F7EDC|nr:uncharacterized protein LOC132201683 [Neocloeon triangulifer]
MIFFKILLFLVLFALVLEECNAGSVIKKRVKISNSQGSLRVIFKQKAPRRGQIIRCCGRNKCSLENLSPGKQKTSNKTAGTDGLLDRASVSLTNENVQTKANNIETGPSETVTLDGAAETTTNAASPESETGSTNIPDGPTSQISDTPASVEPLTTIAFGNSPIPTLNDLQTGSTISQTITSDLQITESPSALTTLFQQVALQTSTTAKPVTPSASSGTQATSGGATNNVPTIAGSTSSMQATGTTAAAATTSKGPTNAVTTISGSTTTIQTTATPSSSTTVKALCLKSSCATYEAAKLAFQSASKGDSTKKYWTSGSNEGTGCEIDRKYNWCSMNGSSFTGQIMNTSLWSAPSATDATLERCISYVFDSQKIGMAHTACTEKLLYICEPTCAMPETTCTPNASLFDVDGKLKDPNQYGFWSEACGEMILFGNRPLTWENNTQMCCNLGMQSFYINSKIDQLCISNLTKFKTWKYNFNYWLGGTKQGCRQQWAWGGSITAGIPSDLIWEKGQPDNKGGKEECLHFKVKNNTEGAVVTDRNCTDKYIMACRGKPALGSLCQKATCLAGDCIRNDSLFAFNEKGIEYLVGGYILNSK